MKKSKWQDMDFNERYDFLDHIRKKHFAHSQRVDESAGGIFTLDGQFIEDIPSFYIALGEAINGDEGYYGACLDSLSDCLGGGFSVIPPFQLIIKQSKLVEEALDERAWLQWVFRTRLYQLEHQDLSMDDLEALGVFQGIQRPEKPFLTRVLAIFQAMQVECKLH